MILSFSKKSKFMLFLSGRSRPGSRARAPLTPKLEKTVTSPEGMAVQVSLVICGRYISSFWAANLELADKCPFLARELSFWTFFAACEYANSQKSPHITRVTCTQFRFAVVRVSLITYG